MKPNINDILFTSVPVGTIGRVVQYDRVATSLIKKEHNKMMKKFITLNAEGKVPIVHLSSINENINREKKQLQKILESWKANHYAKSLRKNTGAYTFIDTPIQRGDFHAGFLLYNEQGKLYLIAYYADFKKIYQYYAQGCKEPPMKPCMIVYHTELCKYLLDSTIPRLIELNKKKESSILSHLKKES